MPYYIRCRWMCENRGVVLTLFLKIIHTDYSRKLVQHSHSVINVCGLIDITRNIYLTLFQLFDFLLAQSQTSEICHNFPHAPLVYETQQTCQLSPHSIVSTLKMALNLFRAVGIISGTVHLGSATGVCLQVNPRY